MVAYPDRGEGNDPEPFFFSFFFFFFRGVGSLSQPRLNIFTVGNMGVMICLGQGGLRSLSASSLLCCLMGVRTQLCTYHLSNPLYNSMQMLKHLVNQDVVHCPPIYYETNFQKHAENSLDSLVFPYVQF